MVEIRARRHRHEWPLWVLVAAAATAAWASGALSGSGTATWDPSIVWISPAPVVLLATWWRGTPGAFLAAVGVITGGLAHAELASSPPVARWTWPILTLAFVGAHGVAATWLRRRDVDLRRSGMGDTARFMLAAFAASLAVGVVSALVATSGRPAADRATAIIVLALVDIGTTVVIVPLAFVLRDVRLRPQHRWLAGALRYAAATVVGVLVVLAASAAGVQVDVLAGGLVALIVAGLVEDRRQRDRIARRLAGELAFERARIGSLLDDDPDGFLALDPVGRVESANRAGTALFSSTAGELVGRSITDLVPVPVGVDPAAHLASLLASGRSGRHWDARRADGHSIPIELEVSRVDTGERWGYNVTARAASVRSAITSASSAIDLDNHAVRAEIDLREAVAADRVVVRYQPILDLGSGEVIAVEALARLRGDDGELIAPINFVPAAERAGTIDQLGAVVIPQALRDLVSLRMEEGAGALRMSVNVSPYQLDGSQLTALVRRSLDEVALPPHALVLEITESAPIDTMPGALEVLRELYALGVGIALDDFGTGFTRLDTIRDLPLDAVKIDRSFVQRAIDSALDRDIIGMIVALAHRRGLTVIAEGIESVEQADVLARLGCTHAQGYLFGQPVDVEELRYLLREWQIVPAIATHLTRQR